MLQELQKIFNDILNDKNKQMCLIGGVVLYVICSQNLLPEEMILIDDNSNDKTKEIMIDYQDKNDFIRGWHGIKYNAFYLPEVMLENVYDNGQWMKHNDKLWPQIYDFNIDETLSKLVSKSGNQKAIKYDIYYNDIYHRDIGTVESFAIAQLCDYL